MDFPFLYFMSGAYTEDQLTAWFTGEDGVDNDNSTCNVSNRVPSRPLYP